MRKLLIGLAASTALLAVAGAANAAFPVYPNAGTENPTLYTFTATGTGDLLAYFGGADAGDEESLGLIINGVDQGAGVFPNHSTPVGTSHTWSVTAGDSLVFYIVDGATNWYSDASKNTGGFNAVYATTYHGGDAGIPAGNYTFVAFEDRGANGDRDYNDETFVFQNVTGAPGAPEPAAWTMMIVGFGAAGAMLRRRRLVAA